MKRITFFVILLLAGLAQQTFAKDGYHITVKLSNAPADSFVFLANYYGKPAPTIYKTDSARLDKNGTVVIQSNQPVIGGIFMIFIDKDHYFEFLLNNGDDMTITADVKHLEDGVKFKNSPENDRFEEYVTFLKGFGNEQQQLEKEYKASKTSADSEAVRKKMTASSQKLTNYRQDYAKKYPGTLLATIFNALQTPVVPEGTHYLADGVTKDSMFAYNYYKAHYWDGFNFQDDRLIHTPLYDAKLDEYMKKLVVPWPDSVEHESDMLLSKTRGTKELFKYTLWWTTHYAETSNIMGMDEVFVYLVENYFMKGDATWLSNEDLAKYTDRASKIAPNVIGNVAPEIKLPNVVTKQQEVLSNVKSKYTLVIFWSPDCGHCIAEMPKIDSLYRAVLKSKGVKIFTVATEGDDKKITEFINKNKLNDWIVTYDPDHTSDYHSKFDVYSTPTIYLLDDKKIIRGKRLDHDNILSLIEYTEKKNKTTQNDKK